MNRAWVLLALAQCGDAALETSMASSTAIPQNPWAAPSEFATQHGDTGASDTSSLPGPGVARVNVTRLDLFAACPSLLPLRSGKLVAVCTQLANQAPVVVLIDPERWVDVARRELAKGSLFGGVYPYLDERDRLVVLDGANNLLRISTDDLSVEQTTSLGVSDPVVGLIPDYQGLDWFASDHGVIGTVDRAGVVATLTLPGERVANSLASAPSGVALVSDQALYLLAAGPRIVARIPYDRGDARKPGQLSWGSGTTPTFFGPHTGSDYVAITDNALPMKLIVVHNDGTPVCTLPLPGIEGSENSPIGAGRSLFVSNTYGFEYAALPADAGPAVSAPFVGGITRVDVADEETSCRVVWASTARTVSTPKLSVPDGLIYTLLQRDDGFAYAAIDAEDGALRAEQQLGNIPTPMMLAPTIGPGRRMYQGTMTAVLRIMP